METAYQTANGEAVHTDTLMSEPSNCRPSGGDTVGRG